MDRSFAFDSLLCKRVDLIKSRLFFGAEESLTVEHCPQGGSAVIRLIK